MLVRIEAQVQEVLRGAAMKTARLHVTLRDVEPAVVRVLDVPATATLPELHNLFQAAFGWWDYHLHQFDAADGTSYGADLDDLDAPAHSVAAVQRSLLISSTRNSTRAVRARSAANGTRSR